MSDTNDNKFDALYFQITVMMKILKGIPVHSSQVFYLMFCKSIKGVRAKTDLSYESG